MALTCRRYGISRKTFYKWYNRFNNRNLLSLEDQSRAPKRRRKWEITREQEARIVKLRKKNLRWGKMKLWIRYREKYGEEISSWKVQRVIEKHQLYYNVPKQTRKRRKKKSQKRRIQTLKVKKRTGFLIHLDTIVQYYEGTRRYIITAIDDVSRIGYARMYNGIGSQNAADFLKRLNYLLEGKIENVHHDNGSEFHKHFAKACADLKIPQYWSRVRRPKDNAKLERFNRTLQEEFMDLDLMADPIDQIDVVNRELTEWLIIYNFKRPHQALDYKVPWEYASLYSQVLPMYSSSS
ncbi:MAG: transposase, partial [Vallitaleaceae bacterium]|nr:transposase [Vallitaleaceae bacterium]